MITRALRAPRPKLARNYFWTRKHQKGVEPVEKKIQERPIRSEIEKMKATDAKVKEKLDWIKSEAIMEYKTVPAVSHWNKDSPDYVAAQREEDELGRELTAYNYWIKNLKTNLALQEEIYRKIEGLDRPYKRGTPGLETNVYSKVKDYTKPLGHANPSDLELEQEALDEGANRHRFANEIVWTPKWLDDFSNMRAWQQEYDNRPVNSHFHPDKGSKFDVFTPYEQRYPHVADRLGYPEFLGDPLDRLFRLEDEMNHPNYLDQPFVQTPPINADSKLNFSEGEVIYENRNVAEWGKFTSVASACSLAFLALWKPYHMLVQSPIPSPDFMEEIGLPYFNINNYNFDSFYMSMILVPAVAYVGISVFMRRAASLSENFATRVQYNADKELLFITTPNIFGGETEHVVETEHCEILVPYVNIGTKFMTANDKDGYFILRDLNKNETYFLNRRET